MKPRIKKDLLQGLLAYPMPAKQHKSKKIAVKQVNSRVFFQKISSPTNRISPRISRRFKNTSEDAGRESRNKDDIWHSFRKEKNI